MSHRSSGILPFGTVVLLLAGCVGAADDPPGDPGRDPTVDPDPPRVEHRIPWDPAQPTEPPGDAGTEPPPDSGTEPPPDPGTEPPPDAGTEPPPPPDPIAALGPLPPEMAGLRWPEQPRIEREVTVTNVEDLRREAGVSGTRIHVRGAVGGDVSVNADDIEILADDATRLGRVSIGHGVSRVRIAGGTYTDIYISIPAEFYPSVRYRPEWMVEDVTIEDVNVHSSNMAFEIRGRRIAIVRSRVTAARYSVWCGDTGPMQSEDVILHENVFDSAGPEATVRLVQVLRSATVSNVLVNTAKHNYRIHGTSDLNYAANNLLINTGVMLGRMPGDDLGRVWFDDNVFHHTAPDLFNPDTGIDMLHATGNVAYTNVWSCFYCPSPQPGWTLASNRTEPYRPPPSY
ncbi:MAG TPA: hypothetical protein VIL20_16600 [Sandaracinaceae bacterium]